jgi:hypothetical protein
VSLNIPSTTPPAPVDSPENQTTGASHQKKTSSTVGDTATISSAALNLAKAAIQEATETLEQTKKEARAGDHQAQRLLAKEQATSGGS